MMRVAECALAEMWCVRKKVALCGEHETEESECVKGLLSTLYEASGEERVSIIVEGSLRRHLFAMLREYIELLDGAESVNALERLRLPNEPLGWEKRISVE